MNLTKGDIILIDFPFSDLSSSKVRPALVLMPIEGSNIIISQITTNNKRKKYSFEINNELLKTTSYVRLDFIMTLDKKFFITKIDSLSSTELLQFNEKFKSLFQL